MDLARFPRRRYTHAPTPIELLPHFTKALAASCPGGVGPEIWIKRDDLLGLFPGGNKTRKLEFLAADALAQGADTLITCGAPQVIRVSAPCASASAARNSSLRVLLPPGKRPSRSSRLIQISGPTPPGQLAASALVKCGSSSIGVGA